MQIKFILPENYKKLKTNLFYLDVAIFIFLPVIYYFLFYIIFIRLNIGNRHILPVYPFVFLFAGFIFQELIKRKIKILSSAIYLIFTLYFIEVLSIAPSYLSFVNILGGGVNNGWKNISDSNYDWGQDFKKLLKWSSQKGNPQINLAYFGNENPEHSNLNYILLPSFRSFTIKSKELQQISNVYLKGYFAISTNHLVGTYLEDFNLGFNPYEYFKHKKPTYKAGTSIIIFKEDESTSKTLLDAAIETYHKKIEKDPDEGDNYSSLASALLLKGEKLEKVINLFYSAIEKNPQNINNYIVLANIFSNTGKLYDAIKIYEKVLISDKNNYLVYNRIGDTYLKLGDIHRAFEYFQKTVEIAPGYFIGWHNFAISAIRLNDLYNAKSAIRKAENIDPDSHMVSNLWGLFYTKKNDRKNAIKFFKNACDKNPNYTFSYINLGELLLEEGRTTEALETFRKINKIPNNVGKISFQE